MHRDVKPHNVMIDHEKRKVGVYRFQSGGTWLTRTSCA
jgi:serine/threonine protein kinase